MDKLDFKEMSALFKEHRNYLKISSELVDYGYMCSWLPVDDQGADFIAVHCKTNDVLKIQLKGRITVSKKYFGKNIHMAFPKNDNKSHEDWVIVPHDELVKIFISQETWEKLGSRSSGSIPKKIWNDVRLLSIIKPVTFN